jgi:hypothetical protein
MNGNNGNHCHCHFHERLIVVSRGDEEAALGLLDANSIPATEVDQGQFHTYIDGLSDDEMGTIVETIALLDVDDPHLSADLLVNGGIDASPVHGLGFMGHSNYKGDDFTAQDGLVHPQVDDSSWDQVIAVVDSGLAPAEDLPMWMSDQAGVLCDRPQDTEVLAFKNPVSHGTFVVSVIRRLAPDFVVSIASARPDPGYLVTDEDPHLPFEALPTDELNVYGALVRLVNRHQDGPGVVALNLALGAHDCSGGGLFLMTMKIALEHWIANFPEAAIFAAGGNSTCAEPVYPAAFWADPDNPLPIRAVGAAEDGGRQVVWVKGNPVPDPGRDWITDLAPGQHIQGLSGQSLDHVIQWSGSSFACAIATAGLAKQSPSTVDGNVTWWPDPNMDYSSIPDLEI